jgi:hypothetical protein
MTERRCETSTQKGLSENVLRGLLRLFDHMLHDFDWDAAPPRRISRSPSPSGLFTPQRCAKRSASTLRYSLSRRRGAYRTYGRHSRDLFSRPPPHSLRERWPGKNGLAFVAGNRLPQERSPISRRLYAFQLSPIHVGCSRRNPRRVKPERGAHRQLVSVDPGTGPQVFSALSPTLFWLWRARPQCASLFAG